jgi:homocitrate synthase
MKRYVHFASRLTGWNAIKSRVEQLSLTMTDAQVKLCTAKIKALADVRPIIRTFYSNLHKETEEPLLPDMTDEEKKKFEQKQRELNGVPEKRELEDQVDAEAEVPQAKKTKTEAGA